MWRELSKQDGSVQPWAPRSIIFILKHAPASALSCVSLPSPPLFFLFAVPNPASPSLSFLCRSRERSGENNALLQEEAALHSQVTVTIGVVNLQVTINTGVVNSQVTVSIGAGSKVAFHSGLYQVLMVTRAAGETRAGKKNPFHLQSQ